MRKRNQREGGGRQPEERMRDRKEESDYVWKGIEIVERNRNEERIGEYSKQTGKRRQETKRK